MNQKKYWEKVAKSYNKLVGETGDLAHKKVVNPIVSDFLGNLKGKVVLDSACGNGYWSKRLAKSAKRVVGIDFTEELIEIAKSKFSSSNLVFKVCDIKNLSFSDNKFDTVLCNMALIDIDDLTKAIGELSRVLKVDGDLVISITHPCFENSPNTVTLKNEKGEKIGRLVKYYFKTGLIKDAKQGWDNQYNYQHYHYTMSDYLNAFARHKLLIRRTSEPNWAEIMKEGYSHTPYFLIFKLKKL